MIIVTGGAGFIGSNLIAALNVKGRKDIVVVDDLSAGAKFRNLLDCDLADYLDKDDFIDSVSKGGLGMDKPDLVFHLGACSDTTEWDGRYMMASNYTYSKLLLNYCSEQKIPFIYASSGAVYGCGREFRVDRACEAPANIYAYSKFLFDQYVRAMLPRTSSQIVGLRYFNVYGPREQHKGDMASVIYQFRKQIESSDTLRLFEGTDGHGDGEQQRDFIYVDDAVAVSCWFAERQHISGIFNVGTGRSQSFNEVARAVLDWHGHGSIEYITFPAHLKGAYQSYTKADISDLREAGYKDSFRNIESGVRAYFDWLATHS